MLLYGLECCHLNKADLQSLDFTSNRLFMKLFRTGSIDVVQECRSYFGVELPSCIIKKKPDKFLSRYNCVENLFCRYCSKLWSFVLLCSELIFFFYDLVKLFCLFCFYHYMVNKDYQKLSATKLYGIHWPNYPCKVIGRGDPFYPKFWVNWPHWIEIVDFDLFSLVAPQP